MTQIIIQKMFDGEIEDIDWCTSLLKSAYRIKGSASLKKFWVLAVSLHIIKVATRHPPPGLLFLFNSWVLENWCSHSEMIATRLIISSVGLSRYIYYWISVSPMR